MPDPKCDSSELFNEIQADTIYPSNEKWQAHLIEQYKMYVEMTDRISQRRATANTYFLSVNSAILAFVGYLTSKDSTNDLWMLALAGITLCFLWERLIVSYRNLNTAKFKIIHAIEKRLPINLYDCEWSFMGRGGDPKLYKPFSHIEIGVPWVFIVLHSLVFLKTFPCDLFFWVVKFLFH